MKHFMKEIFSFQKLKILFTEILFSKGAANFVIGKKLFVKMKNVYGSAL